MNTRHHRLKGARVLIAAGVLALAAAGSSTLGADAPTRHSIYDHGRIHVCLRGCRFNRIQKAVNAARSGDTIEIGHGTYFENVTISGKNLTVAGASAELTTIDGRSLGPVISLEGTTVTLKGLTIVHGSGVNGGGIAAGVADLEVDDSVIASNVATQTGGGIDVLDGSLTLTGSVVTRNNAPSGGGIHLWAEIPATIDTSALVSNEADIGAGIYIEYASRTTITRSTVSNNVSSGTAGGIWISGGDAREAPSPYVVVNQSAVVENTAQTSGGIDNTTCPVFRTCLSLTGGSVVALNSPGP